MGDSVDMSRHCEPQTPISHRTLSHAPGARRAASNDQGCPLWCAVCFGSLALERPPLLIGWGGSRLWACFRYRYGPWLPWYSLGVACSRWVLRCARDRACACACAGLCPSSLRGACCDVL
jgi:hypothetical protein